LQVFPGTPTRQVFSSVDYRQKPCGWGLSSFDPLSPAMASSSRTAMGPRQVPRWSGS
jgi:hypothetical protein